MQWVRDSVEQYEQSNLNVAQMLAVDPRMRPNACTVRQYTQQAFNQILAAAGGIINFNFNYATNKVGFLVDNKWLIVRSLPIPFKRNRQ